MSPERMKLVAAIAVAIAGPAEGLRQYAYYDPPGILTVCKGHTGPDVIKGKKYSLAECDKFMTDDMRKAVLIVERCHPGLPVNVHAAFSDAVFNMGSPVVCNSTASKFLSAGNYAAACNQLPRWNKARIAGVYVELPGLTKRRGEEVEVCLDGLE